MAATKVNKAPVRGGTGTMGWEELYPGSSRSLGSLREMRLKALLRDMIDAEGGAKAAETLGVSYRTVSRAVESGRLTARMSAALERHLLLGGGSAAAQQRERVDALVERVSTFERELRGGLEAVVGEVKAFRGGARKVDAARGAAAGAVGGGKDRVRNALSDRSRD